MLHNMILFITVMTAIGLFYYSVYLRAYAESKEREAETARKSADAWKEYSESLEDRVQHLKEVIQKAAKKNHCQKQKQLYYVRNRNHRNKVG